MASKRSRVISLQSYLLPLAVFLLLTGSAVRVHGNTSSENRGIGPSQHCTDFNPQNALDIEQIMGIWYGSEVITHDGRDEGETVYDSCIVMHLADVTNSTPLVWDETSRFPGRGVGSPGSSNYEPRFATSYGYGSSGGGRGSYTYDQQNQQNRQGQLSNTYQNRQYAMAGEHQQEPHSMRYLRLIWDETKHTLEYTLRYNSSRPGFWISSSPQSGSMAQLQYVQFTGTVQVLKAVNNQLVLNFCQSLPGGQLFTVVLSRVPMGLAPEEVHSIRNLLRRRGLATTSVRKVCQSGAIRSDLSFGAMLLLVILSAVAKTLR
ncbi:AGAP003834-PA-like protein [Anopheles sinensis]|uniref:AGAP003834-PA-like protein n=1 Tax=Anopheles sinensis TaxID=74873 RepID=A0A084WNT3_ANOSI|nr:AGAP003834-PA-like protein [Anopheles sinensis]